MRGRRCPIEGSIDIHQRVFHLTGGTRLDCVFVQSIYREKGSGVGLPVQLLRANGTRTELADPSGNVRQPQSRYDSLSSPEDPEPPLRLQRKKQQIYTTATWYLADLDSEESDSKTEAEGSGVKTAPAAHSTDEQHTEHQPNQDFILQ